MSIMSTSDNSFEHYPGLPYRDQLVKLIVGTLLVEGGYTILAKRLDTKYKEQLPEPFKWEYGITAFMSTKHTVRIETKNIGAGVSEVVIGRRNGDNPPMYILSIPPHPTRRGLRRMAYIVLSLCNRLSIALNSPVTLDPTYSLKVSSSGTIISKFTCSCPPCISMDSIEEDVNMMMNKNKEGTYE